MSKKKKSKTERPDVWVGHVGLKVNSFTKSLEFFKLIGMRSVVRMPGLAVLELRGGTHLVLRRDKAAGHSDASFDLMVDDLTAIRNRLIEDGYAPSEIEKSFLHNVFYVTDPSGIRLQFNDTHVVGVV